ncbi:FAD-binding domain-containing protein [Pseudoalteromonas sp. SSDWG2]|uniref:FAD-binding domain-containing protein n=1 Tax=Pseudoalteromonas sp. SSDWG2 TaxID=3139391 RepID=UPI003BA9B55E
MINLVWLKRDLRLQDHAALHFATQSERPILCVYVIEPQYWQLPDTSKRQFVFVAQALRSLANQLEQLGGYLLIRQGNVVDVLTRIHAHAPIHTLYNHQETGNSWTFARDCAVYSWCKANNIEVSTYRQQAVFRGVVDRDAWQNKANAWLDEPCFSAPKNINSLIKHHDGIELLNSYCGDDDFEAQSAQIGQHISAQQTLHSFINQRINQYRFGISSIIKSPTASSRLSPYLAYGLVSLRQSIQQLHGLPPLAGNRNAILSRMHWHSHFVQKLESEPEYCEHAVHRDLINLRADEFDEELFTRWCQGCTGVPFVDACMRYLHEHGWLNFRMRAMLIAFSSYQLWLDWKKPAAFLAQQFVDYEPGIHYPQVQMQSGTTGINPWRMYNPVTQGQKFDTTGAFIRRWLPELDHIPNAYIHTPWQYCGLKTDVYDKPKVLPEIALRQAKEKISAFYKKHVQYTETKRVISTHASRKRSSKKRTEKKNEKQLNLF